MCAFRRVQSNFSPMSLQNDSSLDMSTRLTIHGTSAALAVSYPVESVVLQASYVSRDSSWSLRIISNSIAMHIAIYPIETLKTQMMSATGGRQPVLPAIKRLLAMGGVRAFYRGLTVRHKLIDIGQIKRAEKRQLDWPSWCIPVLRSVADLCPT